MATEKWSALGTYSAGIAGGATAPTLKNLSGTDGKVLGNVIDNGDVAARHVFSLWELLVRFASAPGEGKVVELYFVKSADNTNFEDGADTTLPASTAFVCAFPVRNITAAQRIAVDKVVLPPGKFKPLIRNNTTIGFTNTDDENVLSYAVYNRTI
jgi:hypothetical protein